ncbi:hypothetical protein FG386_000941 [Cryptosporidium ryanae]|uniref:uncharacterized protein n=1 Tax=Cryptosporidium ryanae TaxID=515981 RepID=UPI00351A8BB9|nr:hypothetical protein FG386_000941 [Cryptosporidium ryanae]
MTAASDDNNSEQVTARNNDIWNLYGLIDPDPLSSTENDDINYVSMVAIGAATSAALWKAHFYRPEEMDDFTTYSMYIITFLTVVGGVYVIYSIRKREKQAQNAIKNENRDERCDSKDVVCGKNDSPKKENDTSSEYSSNNTEHNANKPGNNMRRRKNRVD